jgi:hypothetical protein
MDMLASIAPLRGATEPESIFRAEVIERHWPLHATRAAATPSEPDSPAGVDPVDAQAAADRAWLVRMMAGRTR